MRIFVTGATGFIGSVVVDDLLKAGHQVLGLARSEEGARSLATKGAQVHQGDLENLESLRSGAAQSDGVIHTAFIHDFSKIKEICEVDRKAIELFGEVLAGSNRPLVVSGGLAPVPGRARTEDDGPPEHSPMPRLSEQTAITTVSKGVRASVIRLPQVHDREKAGLVTYLIDHARKTGVSAYIGQGLNRWPAAHKLDVAPLYRLALEKGVAGSCYQAVAEEGVPLKQIAEAVGRRLNLPTVSKSPEEAAAHFGWMTFFAGMDSPASSALTQQRLGWHPTQKQGLIADLEPA